MGLGLPSGSRGALQSGKGQEGAGQGGHRQLGSGYDGPVQDAEIEEEA
jgi:hypothetical protein